MIWSSANRPDRLAIVRISWRVAPTVTAQYVSMNTTPKRSIAAVTSGTSQVIRLAANDTLVVVSQEHLLAAGLAPTAHARKPHVIDIDVVELAGSLQLREALILTAVSESAQLSGQPLVH
jgi:hypothetical protein